MYWILLATTVVAWMLLYLYFRDWKGALRPTISGVISGIWGLGFIHLIGFSLDPLTLVIPFFITARAVSHSAQMHERYYEEYRRCGWQKEEAIVRSFAALFVPTLSGILTDALGVLAILLVPIVLLQKLALTASFWIAAIVVSELFLNPVVYFYLNPPEREMVESREHGLFQRWIDAAAHAVVSPMGRRVSLVVWVVVMVGEPALLDTARGRRFRGRDAAPAARFAVQLRAQPDPGRVRRDRTADHRRRGPEAGGDAHPAAT